MHQGKDNINKEEEIVTKMFQSSQSKVRFCNSLSAWLLYTNPKHIIQNYNNTSKDLNQKEQRYNLEYGSIYCARSGSTESIMISTPSMKGTEIYMYMVCRQSKQRQGYGLPSKTQHHKPFMTRCK